MEDKKKTLKYKKVLVFSLLFSLFMIIIGYTIISSSNQTNIVEINYDLKNKESNKNFDTGMVYYDDRKYEEASRYFQKSIDNGLLAAHALLGECKLHLKDLISAEYHLKEALKVKDGEKELKGYYAGVEYNLGVVYYLKGDNKQANEHLNQAKLLGNQEAYDFLKKLE